MSLDLSIARPGYAEARTANARITTPRISAENRVAANDAQTGGSRETDSRPVDPMLLVHEERVRTIRMIAQWLRRGFASVLVRA